ncbi:MULTISPECIES: peptide-methionine (S)-S-oxide reductase MsrA [unclassified Prochlorococcus]|uniref:peptide-methionine (S)-S-oxide reductase MsrA n=1 Tax=unclassified Prochlorococcus TaxID=2627481 RepID=UPI0005338290|nr:MULTISPECIES: peptide-methionine (S)-S-oxide reductase MsrA [unclassified Prochlorococcus]KGG16225.1 Peptide methionine sulfoxide reductase MsrA [Prochlorococcus sp. MIT 0603]KGG18041.1 Peptide methionine sulfoxide reductase MsrA [Prochlorococcus sp. MIT 0602]
MKTRKFLSKLISLLISFTCLFSFAISTNATENTSVLAGGCFWCLEHDLEDIDGVLSVESGYSGGRIENPTYKNHQGHQEAVKVTFESAEIKFEDLLKSYFRNIDPFDGRGQFCDRGDSYRPVIFYNDLEQKNIATLSVKEAAKELSVNSNKIAVRIQPKNVFWSAEDYHQDYAKKNTLKYNFYRYSCQRDRRLDEVWGINARKGADWDEGA